MYLNIYYQPLVGVKTKGNMSENIQASSHPEVPVQKEDNLRKQREYYEKMLAEERKQRSLAEAKANELSKNSRSAVDDDDDEPYVDQKRLAKQMSAFRQDLEKDIDQKAEAKARQLLDERDKQAYLKERGDFHSVMKEEVIERFANEHPALAETILRMPPGFEREKLVYEAIKTSGTDKPKAKEQSIQDKVNANMRSPYYQPSGTASAPYQSQGDFSQSGQKNAYDQLQKLKARLGGVR